MEQEKAIKLRAQWGDKECSHPEIQKETILGAQTMDYVCTTCGKEFTGEEYKELRK